MTINLVELTSTVKITFNNVEIDAHWNSFDDWTTAQKYFNEHVVKLPGQYGFVKIKKERWEIIDK